MPDARMGGGRSMCVHPRIGRSEGLGFVPRSVLQRLPYAAGSTKVAFEMIMTCNMYKRAAFYSKHGFMSIGRVVFDWRGAASVGVTVLHSEGGGRYTRQLISH